MFVPLVLAFIFLLLVKLWSSGRKSDGSGSVLQSGPLPKPSSESDEKPSKRKALPPRGSFAQVGLRRHNEKRALHGSKAMKIDNSLCTLAQSWADELARTNNFMHSTDNDLGENIYAVLGSDVSVAMFRRGHDSCVNYCKCIISVWQWTSYRRRGFMVFRDQGLQFQQAWIFPFNRSFYASRLERIT